MKNKPEAVRSRQFHGQLFFGMGDESEKLYKILQARLAFGCSMLSGVQQGGPADKEQLRQARADIQDVVLDVATALGVKIEVKGDLPYEESQ